MTEDKKQISIDFTAVASGGDSAEGSAKEGEGERVVVFDLETQKGADEVGVERLDEAGADAEFGVAVSHG